MDEGAGSTKHHRGKGPLNREEAPAFPFPKRAYRCLEQQVARPAQRHPNDEGQAGGAGDGQMHLVTIAPCTQCGPKLPQSLQPGGNVAR